jgi:hypothetical protein
MAACTGIQAAGRQDGQGKRDEAEVDKDQKEGKTSMPGQYAANRDAAVWRDLWRNALFGRVQQQLKHEKSPLD